MIRREGGIFTWRVILALLLALLILEPMIIWGNLTFGPFFGWITLGTQYVYGIISSTIIILIMAELFRFSRNPITKQELFAITIVDRVVGLAVFFQSIPWIYFFVKSPYRISYGITPPRWWAPPEAINVVETGMRTLLHPAWLPIISLMILSMVVTTIVELTLGYLFFRVRVIEEKLEFPVQAAVVTALTTLGEAADPRYKKAYRIFLFSLVGGVIIGMFNSLGLLSLTMYDLNYFIEVSFPGASLAIYPLGFFQGFIIPWYVSLTMFISAFAVYFIGNHLLVRYGLWRHVPPSPGLILRGWTKGMITRDAIYYSTLNFWVSIFFGFALALGILPVIIRPKKLIKALKTTISEERKIGGWVLLIPFMASTALFSILISSITNYPLFPILFLTLVMSFILSYVWSGMLGITGYTPVSIPYLKEAVITLGGGGSNLSIWFASPLMLTDIIPVGNAAGWTGTFMQCYQLGVRFRDYIILYIAMTIAAIIVSIVLYSVYWSFAPIPSALYPGMSEWEGMVIDKATWLTIYSSYNIFKPNLITLGFIAGSILFAVSIIAKVPWLVFSVFAGMTVNDVAYAGLIPQLIGALVRYVILPKVYKGAEEEVANAAYLFYSGIMMGFSIWAVVFVALNFVPKALWVLPY